MTEILTESFCERCGTRYTFESAAPRKSRLSRVRTVSRGLKNYVLQDESTFSEAMADARSEDERSATSHQLDAFHKTFNFCMTCRQYTCGNCWNTEDGRCLTCAPAPGAELEAAAGAGAAAQPATTAPLDASWPEVDLGSDRLVRAMGIAAADPGELALDREAPPAGEPDGGLVIPGAAPADAALTDAALTDAEPGQAAAALDAALTDQDQAASTEPTPVRGLAPGQRLEDAVAAYEAQVAAEEAAQVDAALPANADQPRPDEGPAHDLQPGAPRPDEPLPAVPTAAEPAAVPVAAEPAAEATPEPLSAAAAGESAAEATPEPATPAPDRASPSATEPPPAPDRPSAPGRDDIVTQPTWPVAASAVPTQASPPAPPAPPSPAAPETPANPWLTVAPDDGTATPEPQWPIASQWGRTTRTDVPTTLAGRQLLPRDNASELWAASAAEVLSGLPNGPQPTAAPAPVAPQPCVNCGLSLSANARFCRRCGSRQG